MRGGDTRGRRGRVGYPGHKLSFGLLSCSDFFITYRYLFAEDSYTLYGGNVVHEYETMKAPAVAQFQIYEDISKSEKYHSTFSVRLNRHRSINIPDLY